MTPTTIAAIFGPLLPLLLLLVVADPGLLPGDAVSVTVAPLDCVTVYTVYVIGFPVAIGPADAVTTGVVTVAPPLGPPPITSTTILGTVYPKEPSKPPGDDAFAIWAGCWFKGLSDPVELKSECEASVAEVESEEELEPGSGPGERAVNCCTHWTLERS